MAHFAELDENDIVLRTLVVGNDQEHRGEEFLAQDLGLGGRWIQTSINNNIRGVFAQPGMDYLPAVDKFMPLKPEANPSFIFDEELWRWVCPLAEPQDADWIIDGSVQPDFEDAEIKIDGNVVQARKPILPEKPKIYFWDEPSVTWSLVVAPTAEEIEEFKKQNPRPEEAPAPQE